MATTLARMLQRRDTAAAWISANPVLLAGEQGWESDTNKFKIGNGVVSWNVLPYQGIMTDADKVKLDASTAIATASTLVLRDASGRAQVATPVASGDIANKAFVDAAVLGLPSNNKNIPVFDPANRVEGNILTYDMQETGSERYVNNTVIQRWIPSSANVSITQQKTSFISAGSAAAFVFIGTANVSTSDITLSPVPISLMFSAYLARGVTDTVQVRMDIAWKTSVGAAISTTTGQVFSPTATLALYSMTASVPATAARAVLIFTAASGTGTVFADRVVARPLLIPPYRAPSIETFPLSLVFEDNFASFDSAVWTKGTSGAEFDNYGIEEWDPALVNIVGGNLLITADFRTPSWFSGLVRSKGLRFWKYGYFEARMRFSAAPGMWPAFTLLPEHNAYGLWARSGGINIMEFVSADPTRIWGSTNTVDLADTNYAINTFTTQSTLINRQSVVATAPTWAGATWHIYGLYWSQLPDGRIVLEHYVDDTPYGTHVTGDWTTPYGGTGGAPFDGYFHIVIDLALGGTWAGTPNTVTTDNATLEVDYVRVSQRLS